MSLTPILTDAKDIRAKLHEKAVAALHTIFPIDLKGRTLALTDVHVHGQERSPDEQKHALLTGGTLITPVRGTLQLKDAQGKILNEAKNFTLVHLPYFTERHTVIMDGNEYQIANMLRRKPGVYTERSENGELSSFFNLSKGRNFSLLMHPEKGTLYMNYGTSNIPLYPVLRAMGVPHEDVAKHWGAGVADANRQKYGDKTEQATAKLYEKLTLPGMPKPATHEGRVAFIQQRYDATAMHPEVNEHTLGTGHTKVTPVALLDASRRLLDTYNGRKAPDDGDSLAFKSFHAIDDFVAERMKLTARSWLPKVRQALQGKTDIRESLRASPFTAGVKDFVSRSPLTAIPTGINPIELIDHAVKVTSLGEGGISSERAIPYEARMTHPTHYGTLDPVRTPESGHAGVDIRASIAAHRDDHGNLFTRVLNVRTKQLEYLKAGDVLKHVIAFPYQDIKGEVDAMVNGVVQKVPAVRVDYQFVHEAHALSPSTTLIPMLRNIQGNRAIMGSKMQTQALPLIQREAPYFQVKSHLPDGRSFESLYGTMIVPTAPISGTVERIENGWIHIRPDTAKTSAAKLKTKTLGPLTAKIDRPKGYTKEWPGGRSWTYPVDYGYVPKVTGEDEEGLDVFLGDDPDGHFESFLKLKEDEDTGKLLPDETKFLVGVTPQERKTILTFYGKEVSARTIYKDMDGVMEAIKRFPGGHKLRYQVEKTAAAEDELVKVPYQQHFPFPSKTYLHHELSVKPGDRVTAGQPLGDSNFTRNGVLALGTNLRVGYMAYHGLNSNDAVVISEGAAKKLTSEHMYREVYAKTPLLELSKAKHKAYFGPKYGLMMYDHLDEDGVVRKGARVNSKDILIAGVTKVQVMGADAILGKISKALTTPYRDMALLWEHGAQGTVVDVVRTPTQVTLLIKTQEQMQIGDKLSNRYGGKGVVAKIIPDHEMVQDAQKRPLDIIMTSAGVVSRINPSQIIETAVNKVVEKTGKPVVYDNATQHDTVQWAKSLLKTHGVSDKEPLYDPLHKRTITGSDGEGVLVGPQYIFKLFKSTDTNFSGHAVGPYDINEQPLKIGGEESAKAIGKMEFDALIAHNARNILHEAATVRGQKNDEFWRALQLGMPLPTPKPSFAFRKFTTMLEGAGVKVDKRDSKFKLLPLMDKDVLSRSAGEIQNNKTVIAKNLRPEAGGLFDLRLTGGPQGTLYSHISLHEPIPSPIFEEPVRRLLGMTQVQFEQALRTQGGQWFQNELARIDVPKKLQALREQMKKASGATLNDVVKQIKYLEALEAHGLKPHEAYIVSKIPVVPPIFRPITPHPTDPGQLMIADANRLYGQLMDVNHVLGETVLPSDRPENRFRLYDAVGQLYGTHDVTDEKMSKQKVKGFLQTIAGKGSPKGGFFQRKLMSRTQDVSGRGTAVPDPNLNMDQIGIPEQMLWQMFDKILVARLVRQGYSPLDAKRLVDTRAPAAKDALALEVKERPVFFNRAPTLHRYSVVGAYAVPVQGKTIRVNPFVEKGLNLDYDGDAGFSSVYVKLPKTVYDNMVGHGDVLDSLSEADMSARFREITGYRQGDCVVRCNLEDFPHGEELFKKAHRTFYRVPSGVEVVALDETQGQLTFQPVTLWSRHENLEVEIVQLASGRQIVTDDDERAVYGVNPETLEYQRRRPKDAVGMFVPVGQQFSKLTTQQPITEIAIPAQHMRKDTRNRLKPTVVLDGAAGRVFGTLIGDGWVACPDAAASTLALACVDDVAAQAFERDVNTFFVDPVQLHRHERIGGDFGPTVKSVRYTFHSAALGSWIRQVIGTGARHKHLPPFFLTAPRNFRLGLWAGLMDTDGSIATSNAKNKPQTIVNFTSVSLRLCQEIVWLAKSFDVGAAVSSTKTPKGESCWQVTFSTPELHKLQEMPCANPEKARRFADFFARPAPRSDLGGYTRQDPIPTPEPLATRLARLYPTAGSEYVSYRRATKTRFVSRFLAQKTLTAHATLRMESDAVLQRWIAIVDNTSVRWDQVVSFEKTGIREDGYDLTVPGFETFMNVEGVILSNTLQIHAPITPGGVADAKRMTLSNLLLSDQTRDKLMVFPQHEAIIGATLAAKATAAGPVHTFKTREEALQAYRTGRLKLTDTIEIASEKRADDAEDDYCLDAKDPDPDSESLLLLSPPDLVVGGSPDEQDGSRQRPGPATGASLERAGRDHARPEDQRPTTAS